MGGLMLGEFHMHTNTSGLRSTSFRPLRAPFPCLAIRQMVPSDLAFLAHDLDHIISFERQLRRPSFVGNTSQVEKPRQGIEDEGIVGVKKRRAVVKKDSPLGGLLGAKSSAEAITWIACDKPRFPSRKVNFSC